MSATNLGMNFDATQVEPSAPMEVLPPGDYTVQIVQSELRVTNNGNGQYLWLEMDILDGEYSNRKLWDRLNINNPNPVAQDIARRALSAICHATGVLHVSDSEQLHFKPMIAVVKVKPAGPDKKTGVYREAQNEIRGYKPANGTVQQMPQRQQQQAAPTQPQQQAVAASGARPPWRR